MSAPGDPFGIAASTPMPSSFNPTTLFSMNGVAPDGNVVEPALGPSQPANGTSAANGASADGGGAPVTPTPTAAQITTWFEKFALANDRVAGVETLGGILASHFHSSPIRVAIGNKQPKRILDHRLGWLPRDSDLWREAMTHWTSAAFDGQWQRTSTSESLIGFSDAQRSSRRLLVWVATPEMPPVLLDSVHQPLDILARLTLRLPSRHLSSWTVMFGKRPKLTIGVMATLFVAGLCFPVQYPVECQALLEPVGERIVAAPFAAVLSDCHVRLGDPVRTDEVLLELDGRPLRLERESLQAEWDQAKKEREMALASRRIADAQQAELKQRQLQRRIQLLDDRLARLQVRSPIDGVVVSGDLERFVGSPLETGQTLMEIAPLDRLSIEVEIPEMEIGYVKTDSSLRVRFAAAGGRSMVANLASISPGAEVREEHNVFVGRVELEAPDENLRPGMRGDATVYGPSRPFVWRLVRAAWERVLWWIGY